MVPGERVAIRVAVHADLDQTVGFKYAGVTGDAVHGEREVLHAGLAEVRLGIRRPGRSSAELLTNVRRRLRARRPQASPTASTSSPTRTRDGSRYPATRKLKVPNGSRSPLKR